VTGGNLGSRTIGWLEGRTKKTRKVRWEGQHLYGAASSSDKSRMHPRVIFPSPTPDSVHYWVLDGECRIEVIRQTCRFSSGGRRGPNATKPTLAGQ